MQNDIYLEKEIEVELNGKAGEYEFNGKTTVTIDIQQFDQFFTHKDDDGTLRHFAVAAMYRFAERVAHISPHITCANVTMQSFPIDYIRREMGVEQARLDRLIEPYLSKPLIAIQWHPCPRWPEGTMTLVDGNHRVVKLSEMGAETVRCFLFNQVLWEKFLIEIPDYDEAALKEDSRVLMVEETVYDKTQQQA